MSEQSDRTWLLPKYPWVMRMTWSELLFAHWQVEPSCIAALLPPHLELDTRDGKAWIGIVPFLMSNIAPRWCPPLPRLSRFLELNVRTYVKLDGKPGVWFFSLDAENPVAVRVARATFNLPYMDATMAMTKRDAATITYQSNRTHRGEALAALDVCYESCGTPFQAIFDVQRLGCRFDRPAPFALCSTHHRSSVASDSLLTRNAWLQTAKTLFLRPPKSKISLA
jgi:hypothetical protein